MPRVTQSFPVSQDIHSDVELWELRDAFGDRAGFVWLEILAIAKRNGGRLPGRWDSYPILLASRCRSTASKVRAILVWLTTPRSNGVRPPCSWVTVDSNNIARVTKWLKYNRLRGADSGDSGPRIGVGNPDLSDPEAVARLGRELAGAVYRIFHSNPKRFSALLAWEREALEAGRRDEVRQHLPKGWAVRVVIGALKEFEVADKKQPVGAWRPYIEAIRRRMRTEALQRESAERKKLEAGSIKGILAELGI